MFVWGRRSPCHLAPPLVSPAPLKTRARACATACVCPAVTYTASICGAKTGKVCVCAGVYAVYTLTIQAFEGVWLCNCGFPSDSPDSHLIYSYPRFYMLWAGPLGLTAILFNLPSQRVCAAWYLTSYIGWPRCTRASHCTVAPLSKSKSAVKTLSPEDILDPNICHHFFLPESVIHFLLETKKEGGEKELEHGMT